MVVLSNYAYLAYPINKGGGVNKPAPYFLKCATFAYIINIKHINNVFNNQHSVHLYS